MSNSCKIRQEVNAKSPIILSKESYSEHEIRMKKSELFFHFPKIKKGSRFSIGMLKIVVYLALQAYDYS